MPLTTIIQGVVGVLTPVTGMGKVYAYTQYAASEKERQDLFVSNGVLNTWFVNRESTSAHDRGAGPLNVRDQHMLSIEGFRAVTAGSDSRQKHEELAEAVRAALHNNRKLPSGSGWLSAPSQVPTSTMVMFMMSILSWYIKITVVAEEVMQGG